MNDDLVPGPGNGTSAYTRNADHWPRHKARARGRQARHRANVRKIRRERTR